MHSSGLTGKTKEQTCGTRICGRIGVLRDPVPLRIGVLSDPDALRIGVLKGPRPPSGLEF